MKGIYPMSIKTFALDIFRFIKYGNHLGTNSKGVSVYKRGGKMTALDADGIMTFRSVAKQTGKDRFEKNITRYKPQYIAGEKTAVPDKKVNIKRTKGAVSEVHVARGKCPNGSEEHTQWNSFTNYCYGRDLLGRRWIKGSHQGGNFKSALIETQGPKFKPLMDI